MYTYKLDPATATHFVPAAVTMADSVIRMPLLMQLAFAAFPLLPVRGGCRHID